jgi:Fe-Mn family superoxide dismutase
LPELGYPYNALEPYIDAQTMEIHYTKHHQGYVNNLNKALSVDQQRMSIEDIFAKMSKYSSAVRNNAGGHYNHSLFWTLLSPRATAKPKANLEVAINKSFGSLDSLKKLLNEAGLGRFGSGWVWLIVDENKQLKICSTPNQDNPLMDDAEVKGYPIIGIDLWEHAYYLKYQNKRGDYLSAIWNVFDWSQVSKRYDDAMK